jgi:hypothetical protein
MEGQGAPLQRANLIVVCLQIIAAAIVWNALPTAYMARLLSCAPDGSQYTFFVVG